MNGVLGADVLADLPKTGSGAQVGVKPGWLSVGSHLANSEESLPHIGTGRKDYSNSKQRDKLPNKLTKHHDERLVHYD